jgi:hypothetical protein
LACTNLTSQWIISEVNAPTKNGKGEIGGSLKIGHCLTVWLTPINEERLTVVYSVVTQMRREIPPVRQVRQPQRSAPEA